MNKDLKQNRRTMSHQIENVNKKIEAIIKYQKKILKLKSIIPEMKKSLDQFISRYELLSKHKDRSIIQLFRDNWKEGKKRMKKMNRV